jgi:hypothetical protein
MTNSTTGRIESCMLVGSEGHKLAENTDPTTKTIMIHSAYNNRMPHINTIGLRGQT